MISLGSFELERRSLVHSSRVVLASCHNAKGPTWLQKRILVFTFIMMTSLTLKSTVLMGLVWPVMSPLLVPVSAKNTCPNFSLPSPTTTILRMQGIRI